MGNPQVVVQHPGDVPLGDAGVGPEAVAERGVAAGVELAVGAGEGAQALDKGGDLVPRGGGDLEPVGEGQRGHPLQAVSLELVARRGRRCPAAGR